MFDRVVFLSTESNGNGEECNVTELQESPEDIEDEPTIPVVLAQAELPKKYNESSACTKDDYCSFYTFSVLELIDDTPGTPLNEWSCGSPRYNGEECKQACCDQQDEYCRIGGFAGWGGADSMQAYVKCMRQRGCDDSFSCDRTKYDKTLNYDVPPKSENDDLCGQYKQGSGRCADACCTTQETYCINNTNSLRVFFDCMSERGCMTHAKIMVHEDGNAQSKGCKMPKNFSNAFDVPCFGEKCEFPCLTETQGKLGCAKECCQLQHSYCRSNTAVGGMASYFKCMRMRGCGPVMSCSVAGGKTHWFQGDDYDFSYLVTPGDSNTHCSTDFQGGSQCNGDCCYEQHRYCGDSNDHLCGYFTCMKDRKCLPYGKNKVHGSTWDQSTGCTLPKKKNGADLANPFDVPCAIDGKSCEYKCIESWYQGKRGCQKECCRGQHEHCRGNNAVNGMEGYFSCMRVRGCESVMSCNTDGTKKDLYSGDEFDFTYNINPNDGDDQCGEYQQGGTPCRNQCCFEQHTYCADSNFNLRGYYQCMMDRRCTDYAKTKVHGSENQSTGCTLPKMKNGKDWNNPFDVPCDLDGNCTYKCEESWYQGKMGCAKECCKVQHDYCRGNNAINGMEGYFSCMRSRGCTTTISCNTDGSKADFATPDSFDFTYKVTPNDNADKCGSERQGASLCQGHCCDAQFEHCKDHNAKLRGFFQCMTERNCFDLAKEKIHGADGKDKQHVGCNVDYAHWKKPFDVPCFGKTCEYTCETSWQGSAGCADKCCAEQEDYCRNGLFANSTMEGYFVCMRQRGCSRVMSCAYDPSTNYDVDKNDTADHCGTYRQGSDRCRSQCCDKQASFCGGFEDAHIFHECMNDRGCLGEAKNIISGNPEQTGKCDWTKNFAVQPNSSGGYKCTGEWQGGVGCKSKCCHKQASFCGCGVNDAGCMDHRGCALGAEEADKNWGFHQGGYTWPKKCKKTSQACTVGGDCANHDLITGKGSQCCKGVCQVKKRDWAGAYYCPHEVTNEWGGGGLIGDPCTIGTDCADHGVGTIKGTACCDGKCADKTQDYVGAWYCPSDVKYKYGGNEIGEYCFLGTHCKGHGVGTGKGTACCDEVCAEKARDYIGAYYCPSEVKYKYGGNPLNGKCELGTHCANHGFGTTPGTACCRADNSKDCPLGSDNCTCQQKTKDWIGAYYCSGQAVNHPTTDDCDGWKCNDHEAGTVCKDTYRCEQCAFTSERRWVTMSNLYTGGSCEPETTDCAGWTCEDHKPGTICTKEGGPFRCDKCWLTGKKRWVTVSNGYTGAEC